MKRMLLFFATLWLGIMGASAQGYHYDVNNDGGVNVSDAVAVVNKILGKENPGEVVVGETVDLGLPSGTLWSSCNIGASSPEGVGNYYAWGETEVKTIYNESTYKYYKNGRYVKIGTDISGTEYDVATTLWGGDWCMPTKQQAQELINNCTRKWTTVNGVDGCKFTSNLNGNSIFIPNGGYKRESNIHKGYAYVMTSTGFYTSSSAGYYSLGCINNSIGCDQGPLYDGTPVRPVRSPLH